MEEAKRIVRRTYTPELEWAMLDECRAGASVASVAMAFAIKANLVHKWRRLEQCAVVPTRSVATPAMPMQTFIPLVIGAPPVPLPIVTQPQEVRIELRGGGLAATVIWPMSANAECA